MPLEVLFFFIFKENFNPLLEITEKLITGNIFIKFNLFPKFPKLEIFPREYSPKCNNTNAVYIHSHFSFILAVSFHYTPFTCRICSLLRLPLLYSCPPSFGSALIKGAERGPVEVIYLTLKIP